MDSKFRISIGIYIILIIAISMISIGCNKELSPDHPDSIVNNREKEVVKKDGNMEETEEEIKEKEEDLRKKDEEKKARDLAKNPLTTEITNKISNPKNSDAWKFSNDILVSMKIINNTDREVKGAEIHIRVSDLFGDNLMNLLFKDAELNIPAKGYVERSANWEINEFINEEASVFSEKFENLKFDTKTSIIIYSDGETVEIQ